MKVEFLNAERTEARLTRGFWLWKRVAIVRETETEGSIKIRYWAYEPSGLDVDIDARIAINEAIARDNAKHDRRLVEANWHRSGALPKAEVRR